MEMDIFQLLDMHDKSISSEEFINMTSSGVSYLGSYIKKKTMDYKYYDRDVWSKNQFIEDFYNNYFSNGKTNIIDNVYYYVRKNKSRIYLKRDIEKSPRCT